MSFIDRELIIQKANARKDKLCDLCPDIDCIPPFLDKIIRSFEMNLDDGNVAVIKKAKQQADEALLGLGDSIYNDSLKTNSPDRYSRNVLLFEVFLFISEHGKNEVYKQLPRLTNDVVPQNDDFSIDSIIDFVKIKEYLDEANLPLIGDELNWTGRTKTDACILSDVLIERFNINGRSLLTKRKPILDALKVKYADSTAKRNVDYTDPKRRDFKELLLKAIPVRQLRS